MEVSYMPGRIEPMTDFFTERLSTYDEHMLTDIEELPEAYAMVARLIPPDAQTLLDLGCGTGLELERVFELHPDILVTGIDLTQAMLDRLRGKFPGKELTLICGSYLGRDLGERIYDAAISFETMHHWTYAQKSTLYADIFKALKPRGRYVECDYMVDTQDEADRMFEEALRLRAEQGVPDGEFYHCDTPMTVDNQMRLFKEAGFASVETAFRRNGTAIIVCDKI
jgi:SAM-dependent methyltransferase